MRCSRAEKLISDHIDGLLTEKQFRKLEKHLKRCLKCKDLQSELRSMVDAAEQLEDISPSKDLWPSIKNRLSKRDKDAARGFNIKRLFPSFPPWPRELSFSVSAFLLGILLTTLFYSATPYIQTNVRIPEQVTSNQYREVEYQYQQAIAALNQVISTQNVELSPEVSAVFEDNLKIIDGWISTFRAALEKNPGDRDATEYLVICYKNKLKLLSDMKKVTMNLI